MTLSDLIDGKILNWNYSNQSTSPVQSISSTYLDLPSGVTKLKFTTAIKHPSSDGYGFKLWTTGTFNRGTVTTGSINFNFFGFTGTIQVTNTTTFFQIPIYNDKEISIPDGTTRVNVSFSTSPNYLYCNFYYAFTITSIYLNGQWISYNKSQSISYVYQ